MLFRSANLKSYSFKKYRTKSPDNFKLKIKIISPEYKILSKKYFRYKAIEEGVDLTRNLVSEPPNILHPKHYVETIKKLSSLGLKISIYDENKMKKMGMNALLGVGQGSINIGNIGGLLIASIGVLRIMILAFNLDRGVHMQSCRISVADSLAPTIRVSLTMLEQFVLSHHQLIQTQQIQLWFQLLVGTM